MMRIISAFFLFLSCACVAQEFSQPLPSYINDRVGVEMIPPKIDVAEPLLYTCDRVADGAISMAACALPINANISLSNLGAGSTTSARVTIDVYPGPKIEFISTYSTFYRAVSSSSLCLFPVREKRLS
jgi:hypothetical protein